MPTIRIAHLSDLHFGAGGAPEVWDLLERHFADPERRPDLVVLTGDLVNTPDDDLFAQARKAVDSLCVHGQIPYFVCAGNHDRHLWGNTARWKFWQRRGERLLASSQRFFDEFGGHVASLEPPQTVALGRWRIRIAGIDSSVDGGYFARGFVPLSVKQKLEGLCDDPDHFDLLVTLVHHHLMPVRALEEERQDKLRSVADVTGLVNAGSVVEALANNHVDLALHGHEHEPNWARYEALESGGRAVIAPRARPPG